MAVYWTHGLLLLFQKRHSPWPMSSSSLLPGTIKTLPLKRMVSSCLIPAAAQETICFSPFPSPQPKTVPVMWYVPSLDPRSVPLSKVRVRTAYVPLVSVSLFLQHNIGDFWMLRSSPPLQLRNQKANTVTWMTPPLERSRMSVDMPSIRGLRRSCRGEDIMSRRAEVVKNVCYHDNVMLMINSKRRE
jgi:hypothetical protein